MTRFIQQQIPQTPTRSVPQTPCPACGVATVPVASASGSKVKPNKKKKK